MIKKAVLPFLDYEKDSNLAPFKIDLRQAYRPKVKFGQTNMTQPLKAASHMGSIHRMPA